MRRSSESEFEDESDEEYIDELLNKIDTLEDELDHQKERFVYITLSGQNR